MQSFNNFCEDNNMPLTTMSNFDIIKICKQLKIKYFRGCLMNDELKNKIKTNECAIINLQNLDQSGTHCCCYYKNGKEKYYFDSYGLDCTNEMLNYLKPSNKSSP